MMLENFIKIPRRDLEENSYALDGIERALALVGRAELCMVSPKGAVREVNILKSWTERKRIKK